MSDELRPPKRALSERDFEEEKKSRKARKSKKVKKEKVERRENRQSDSSNTVAMSEVLEKQSNKSSSKGLFITGSINITFLIFTFILVVIGLVMLYSASYPYAYKYEDGNSFHYIERQLFFVVVGSIVMFLFSKINYRIWQKFSTLLYFVALALLVVVLFYHTDKGDFKRWIPIASGITLQPSDLAKFTLVLALANYIYKHKKGMTTIIGGYILPLIIVGVYVALIYLENHLSCMILMAGIFASMIYVGGANRKIYFICVVAVVVGAVFLVLHYDLLPTYQAERIKAWLDKDYDPTGSRWQTNNSLYAIGSGGVFGVGLGNSTQKYLYVSEPQNDFIFAIVCEELGLVGAFVIIFLFGCLFVSGLNIAMDCKDKFGRMLVIGIVSQIAIQTILNIGVVTDFLPNTGISLPFFSYGGTSILMLLGEVGIVLSVSRSNSQYLVEEKEK